MVKVFIRQEDECGHGKVSAQEHINQFKAPVLFGRLPELTALDNAWNSANTNVVLIHGAAGIGKSALIERWLHNLQKKQWNDAEIVYSWSFFPPDLTRPLQHPVDEFFDHALRWFGESHPEQFTHFFQAERLIQLIQEHHTLLIVDGLHFWQTHSGSLQGHLADPRLTHLFKRLAERNPGLCVGLSIQPLPAELDQYKTLQRLALDKLPLDICAQILRYKGVQASDEKLQQIAEDFEQNPLNLHLLGGYLNIWHGGNWRQIESIPVLLDDNPEGRHARRILTANASRLQTSAGAVLLYQLSLLYQPILRQHLDNLLKLSPRSFLRWLIKKPDTYAEVMRPYRLLNVSEQQKVIRQLQELGLLNSSGRCLCAHPWVKVFFQKEFRSYWPVAWKQANQLLIQYYHTLPTLAPRLVQPAAAFVIPEASAGSLVTNSAASLAATLRTAKASLAQHETWFTNASLAANAILASKLEPLEVSVTTPSTVTSKAVATQSTAITHADLADTAAVMVNSTLSHNRETVVAASSQEAQKVMAQPIADSALNTPTPDATTLVQKPSTLIATTNHPALVAESTSSDSVLLNTPLPETLITHPTTLKLAQQSVSPVDQAITIATATSSQVNPTSSTSLEPPHNLPATNVSLAAPSSVLSTTTNDASFSSSSKLPALADPNPTAPVKTTVNSLSSIHSVKSLTLNQAHVKQLNDLLPQLYNFQRSLQILHQRTKKFQKSMRQLEKEVQSMHYSLAPTGTDA